VFEIYFKVRKLSGYVERSELIVKLLRLNYVIL